MSESTDSFKIKKATLENAIRDSTTKKALEGALKARGVTIDQVLKAYDVSEACVSWSKTYTEKAGIAPGGKKPSSHLTIVKKVVGEVEGGLPKEENDLVEKLRK